MAFCTAADVETFAQIDFNSALETVLTNEIIPIVEDVIRDYLGCTIDYGTYTETMDGNQTRELFVEEMPILTVTSVKEDGTTLTHGNREDYLWYENGRLRRIGRRWSYAYASNIEITYTAGYNTGGGTGRALPRAFKVATARAAARVLEAALVLSAQQEPGEITPHTSSAASNFTAADSESLGDYSIQYVGNLGMNSIAILSAADLQLLGKYRKNFFI